MPPKKRFSREQIVDAAFTIAVEDGIDSITIRRVAQRIGGSIAPIYGNFSDVDELIQAVIARTATVGKQMLEQEQSGNPFWDVGAASLRFASEYPVLLKDMLFHQDRYHQSYQEHMGETVIEQMRQDPQLSGLGDEDLRQLLLQMQVFQAGLSLMTANGVLDHTAAITLLRRTGEELAQAKGRET